MARLEMATRHRPFHIGLLLVSTAPPANPEDDIYGWERQSASVDSRAYIESLFRSVGISLEKTASDQLADLQRRGVYLAGLVECPLADAARVDTLSAQYGPVLVKRIGHSYKPRQIGLLAPAAPGLAELLRDAGFGELLVASGKGIEIPAPDDADGFANLRATLGNAIAASESS